MLSLASPMDAHGWFSISLGADYTLAAIAQARAVVLEVNPNVPFALGNCHVHVSQVAALVETTDPLLEVGLPRIGPVQQAIGHHVAEMIEDGSTLQIGYGGIPDAVVLQLAASPSPPSRWAPPACTGSWIAIRWRRRRRRRGSAEATPGLRTGRRPESVDSVTECARSRPRERCARSPGTATRRYTAAAVGVMDVSAGAVPVRDNGALERQTSKIAMTASTPVLRGCLALACAFACQAAWAQAPAPLAAASAAERAQQQTDRTMYWIRVLASKPAPARAAAPRPIAAAPVPQARPLADAREKVKVAALPAPATSPAAARTSDDAASPAPAPLAAAGVDGLSDPATANTGATADIPADAPAAAAAAAAAPEPSVAPPPAEEPDPGLVRIKLVQPDFPSSVLRRIPKGSIEVRFEVEPGGTVVEAEAIKSPHAGLSRAAVEAVKQWRFQPTAKSHTALVNLVFDADN